MEPIVSRSSWHYCIYQDWLEMKYGKGSRRETVQLCPYVRVILFWWFWRKMYDTALRGSLFSTFLFTVLTSVIYLVFGLKGVLFQGKIIMLLTLAGIITAVLLYGAHLIDEKVTKRRWARREQRMAGEEPPPTFSEILVLRWDAFHGKICPILKLGE